VQSPELTVQIQHKVWVKVIKMWNAVSLYGAAHMMGPMQLHILQLPGLQEILIF